MNIFIITILFLLYFTGDIPDFLIDQSTDQLTRALTYSFFHANIFHLLVNCIVAYRLFKTKSMRLLPRQVLEFFMAYIISVLVYRALGQPIVGFSVILYALIGLRSEPTLRWWKRPQVYFFLVLSFGMLFIPQFAGASHLVAFFTGVTISNVCKVFKCQSGLKKA